MATPLAPTSVTVSNFSTQILPASDARQGCALINLGTEVVSLGLGFPAVLNQGITLAPGGAWSMDSNNISTSQVNGIASTASSIIAIQEWV